MTDTSVNSHNTCSDYICFKCCRALLRLAHDKMPPPEGIFRSNISCNCKNVWRDCQVGILMILYSFVRSVEHFKYTSARSVKDLCT